MDELEKTELTVMDVECYLNSTDAPTELDAARQQVSDLRCMLRSTHQAYTKALQSAEKYQLLALIFGCMVLTIVICTILEGLLQ
jgi:hypothetical protein